MQSEHYSFAVLVHSTDIINECRSVMADSQDKIQYELVDLENGPRIAHEYLDKGFDVVLCHGGTGKNIMHSIPNSVVLIERTDMDVIKALQKAKHYSNDIILAAYRDEFHDINTMERLLNIKIHQISYDSSASMRDAIKQCVFQGICVLVGGGLSKAIIEEFGGKGFVVGVARQNVFLAFERAHYLAHAQREEKSRHTNMMLILEHLQEGVICIDANQKLMLANETARRLLKTGSNSEHSAFQAYFKPLGLIDAISGVSSIEDKIVDLNGETFIATTYPLALSPGMPWAVSIFRDAPSLQKISNKMSAELRARGFTARKQLNDIKGCSSVIVKMRDNLKQYAESEANVFIQGETGTGKELAAHALHSSSQRKNNPFVAVNISSLPTQLVESELFGYEEGAFTGAKRGGKLGLFEMANHGTLFLDEIGDINAETQLRLLRVMETREVLRVGGNRIYPVDVRIVSASNKPLLQLVKQGNFRLDLYYRLTTFKLKIPPLRQRLDDIPELLGELLTKYHKNQGDLSPQLMQVLTEYAWPGNIRELFSVIENYFLLLGNKAPDASLLKDILYDHATDNVDDVFFAGDTIQIQNQLPRKVDAACPSHFDPKQTLKQNLLQSRQQILLNTIQYCKGDKKQAAQQLGISYSSFCRLIKELNIQPQYGIDA